MALRVWLPLNGNLNNQGLSTIVPSGTPTFLDNGKIGKCISLTPRVSFTGMPRMDNFTVLFWLKVDSCSVDWADSLSFTSIQADGSSAAPFRFEATKTSRACSFHNNTPYAITTGSRILITEAQKGEWHHCGFSYDGEHCYTYIDGVLTYTDTGLGGYINNYFHIGETNNMVGGMNDLRVYDECLSQKQIKEISKGLVVHYKLEGPGVNPNLLKNTSSKEVQYTYPTTGTYKDWFSGQTTEIPSASKYTLSFYAKSTVDGDKVRSHYYNPNTTTTCVSSQGVTKTAGDGNMDFTLSTKWEKYWVTYTQTETTAVKNIIFPRMMTSGGGTGIVSVKEVKFEEGEKATSWIPNTQDALYNALGYNNIIARDSSGNGHHLSANGTQTYNPNSARYSGSTRMGGTNVDYLRGPILDFLKSPFTFNCWIYQTSATSTSSGNTGNTLQFIMGQGRDCGYAGFALCSANGYARLYLGSATSGTYWGITDNTVSLLNGWHMLTGTFDGANAKLYVDGSLKKTQASTVDPVWTDTGGFVIGKMSYSYTNTGAYFPFVGSISDAKVYATALSADDILTMYKNSGIIDNKGNVYAYEFKEE